MPNKIKRSGDKNISRHIIVKFRNIKAKENMLKNSQRGRAYHLKRKRNQTDIDILDSSKEISSKY